MLSLEEDLMQRLEAQSQVCQDAIDGWERSLKREQWFTPLAFVAGSVIGFLLGLIQ